MSAHHVPVTIGGTFLQQGIRRANAAFERIKHCVDQLDDSQVWWRPISEMNSIANILLHLCGNLNQWIIASARQLPDERNRPQEFAERGSMPTSELMEHFEKVITEVKKVLEDLSETSLLEPRRIQGFDETVLSALFDSLSHLAGHAQEITYITRLQLGDRYRFAWVPTTREQGAAE